MHNLIKSRAVFEILKKPFPELLRFYRDSDSESESVAEGEEEQAGDAAAEAEAATAEADAEAAKLNVNASVFVPRSKESNDLQLGELKRHFEALDVRKPLTQPKLMLPWKGFPKPPHVERAPKSRKSYSIPKASSRLKSSPAAPAVEPKARVTDEETKVGETRLKRANPSKESRSPPSTSHKKQQKEHPLTKSPVPDEKRREQERKVALEALKLVEQRRMRDAVEQPQFIVHLTRSPVDFTPEERVRVNRLRIIKREHIERVLREMRDDMQPRNGKGQPANRRYICLQPQQPPPQQQQQQALPQQAQPPPEQQPKQQPQQQAQETASGPPRRYIPTVKQWDERCKAKASEAAAGANKENNSIGKTMAKQEESSFGQRAMVPSSQANIMPGAAPSGPRESFVPRYCPPAPLITKGERRRGNLTHARNISRAFANCGLLPTPARVWHARPASKPDNELPPEAAKSVKRYNMEELLELEPQPHQLQKPHISESLCKLGFICESPLCD